MYLSIHCYCTLKKSFIVLSTLKKKIAERREEGRKGKRTWERKISGRNKRREWIAEGGEKEEREGIKQGKLKKLFMLGTQHNSFTQLIFT